LKKFALIAAVLISGYVVWGLVYPSASWRYKLTIAVETPEGIKTGSSVIQVNAGRQPELLGYGTAIGIRGEAAAVDLGERGVLLSLLVSKTDVDYGYRIVFEQFPFQYGGLTKEGIAHYASLRAKAELSPSQLPMLVRFRDTNDPKTVELVDPNDLAKSFGADVQIKSATIEMVNVGIWPFSMFGITGEPVTRGIATKLGWLDDLISKEKQHGVYRYNDGIYRATAEDFYR
jgi:hypothetical protein